MAFPTFLSSAFIFLFLTSSFVESKSLGFTLDLIHRDSPGSPYYNPNTADRLSNTLLRSHQRAASYFDSAASLPSSAIVPDGGGYLMNYTLGTPPVPILSVADTGSDIIWTQCAPCEDCYQQNAPLFDPKKSKTYKGVSCESEQCGSIPDTFCNGTDLCTYQISYGDRSHSTGVVATETVGLGSALLPNVTFGCGFDNAGTFSKNDSGIVGLGGGPASLVSQLGSSINGKFSYCLLPEGSTGKINFGDNAVVSGDGVVSTDIHTLEPNTFYYLSLSGFTVGGSRVDFFKYSADSPSQSPSQSPFPSAGTSDNAIDIIIDSGTTLTYLPSDLYFQLEEAIKNAVKAEPVNDPQGILELCYNTSGGLKLPGLTMHFVGADVELEAYNVYIATAEDVACLAFSTSFQVPIYGNVAQTNFLVGYDLVKKTVSFKPNGCGTN